MRSKSGLDDDSARFPSASNAVTVRRAQVDEDLAGVADHLAGAARRPLDVVLVDVHRDDSAVDRAFQQDAGRVLDVDLEPRQVTAQRKDTRRHPEQPVDVVQFVDLATG